MQITNMRENLGQPAPEVIERLRRDVEACAIPRDVYRQPQANQLVRRWLVDRFESLGYTVELQGGHENVVALPAEVAGPLPLVGAHYDSVPTAPGADDNASAVAVMLEVARRAVGKQVAFVGFNTEEHRLAGSFDFVENLPDASFEVTVAHVLEMVGYTASEPGSQSAPLPLPGLPDIGDFIGLIVDHRSTSFGDAVLATARSLTLRPPVTMLQLPPGALELMPDAFRSDHAPFWLKHRPALMWTDTSEFRNPHYHRPSDTPDTLDYGFMARVAELVAACVVGGGAPAGPA